MARVARICATSVAREPSPPGRQLCPARGVSRGIESHVNPSPPRGRHFDGRRGPGGRQRAPLMMLNHRCLIQTSMSSAARKGLGVKRPHSFPRLTPWGYGTCRPKGLDSAPLLGAWSCQLGTRICHVTGQQVASCHQVGIMRRARSRHETCRKGPTPVGQVEARDLPQSPRIAREPRRARSRHETYRVDCTTCIFRTYAEDSDICPPRPCGDHRGLCPQTPKVCRLGARTGQGEREPAVHADSRACPGTGTSARGAPQQSPVLSTSTHKSDVLCHRVKHAGPPTHDRSPGTPEPGRCCNLKHGLSPLPSAPEDGSGGRDRTGPGNDPQPQGCGTFPEPLR